MAKDKVRRLDSAGVTECCDFFKKVVRECLAKKVTLSKDL